jgi:hypothetical protein
LGVWDAALLNSSFKTSITLILKTGKATIRKENNRSMSLMNTDKPSPINSTAY